MNRRSPKVNEEKDITSDSYYVSTRLQDVDGKVYTFSVTGKFDTNESVEETAKNLAFLLERSIGVSGATYRFYEIGPREVLADAVGC